MLYLDLEETCAGMVLGQDVLDTRGHLLLQTGCTLTDGHLHMLRVNQIRRVPVVPAQTPCHGAHASVIDSCIEARFRFCDNRHPLILELRRLSRQRITRTEGGMDDD